MSSTTRKLTAAAAASVLAATAFCCALPAGIASAAGSSPKISMELLAGGSAIGMEIYIDLPDSDTPADCRIEFDDETPELTAVNGEWMFTASEYAMNMTKEHTLKITANDGSYTVSATATHIWTPAGMISAVRNVSVMIDGTIYDDWYQG